MSQEMFNVILIAILVFFINLPFGYWRGKHRRFTFKWFLFIHFPVPLVILLRVYGDVGFAFYTYPILVGAFFMGQYVGRSLLPCIVTGKMANR